MLTTVKRKVRYMAIDRQHSVSRHAKAMRSVHIERTVDVLIDSHRGIAVMVKELAAQVELLPVVRQRSKDGRHVVGKERLKLRIVLEDNIATDAVVQAILEDAEMRPIATPGTVAGRPVIGRLASVAMNRRPYLDFRKAAWIRVACSKVFQTIRPYREVY